MKKLLLGSVALIVMSAPVLAADMPVKVMPLPPAWSWTGCYVGLNVGYGVASSQSDINLRHSNRAFVHLSRFRFDANGTLCCVLDRLQLAARLCVLCLETDRPSVRIEVCDHSRVSSAIPPQSPASLLPKRNLL